MKTLIFLSRENKIKKVSRVEINSFLLKKLNEFLPKLKTKEICGTSPPEVFVGRIGYPKVFVGPMVSPLENSENLLYTEKWFGKSLEEIFAMRFQIVRGKSALRINDLNNKNVIKLQEAILSARCVEMEAKFKNTPKGFRISLDHQPFGPSAYIEEFNLRPNATDFKIEKVFYDFDFKASEAVFWLYSRGVPISKIQQAFSIGMIGVRRKLVPTRWSITAVDDIIGKHFIEKIKEFPTIDEYRVYYNEYLNNRWIILMFPSYWQYESIEAWYPGTISNYFGIGGDYERYELKKDYASIGGCWYAARAMVAEKLYNERRQAGVLILREIHEGYIPVGVWNVRESVRNTLSLPYERFSCMEEALTYVGKKLEISVDIWKEYSKILQDWKNQCRLNRFLRI